MSIPVQSSDSDEIFGRLANELEHTRAALVRAEAQCTAWRDYAEHVEGCRECGEMSWQWCSKGTLLRIAAVRNEIVIDERSWEDVADEKCNLCSERLGDHNAYDFACPRRAALQEGR